MISCIVSYMRVRTRRRMTTSASRGRSESAGRVAVADSPVHAWSLQRLRTCYALMTSAHPPVGSSSDHCSVKLISGALSHENTGNQFGHASVIFTFIFLAVTAVCQIICLNKGLAVYDSTLVVPVFYGVYTGLG